MLMVFNAFWVSHTQNIYIHTFLLHILTHLKNLEMSIIIFFAPLNTMSLQYRTLTRYLPHKFKFEDKKQIWFIDKSISIYISSWHYTISILCELISLHLHFFLVLPYYIKGCNGMLKIKFLVFSIYIIYRN